MKRRRLNTFSLVLACLGATLALVPASAQDQQAAVRKVVWERPILLVNYNPGSNTPIDFQGTDLLPEANGSGRVKIEGGVAQIEANFRDLAPPPQFGSEYTTYVLWAVTSEGKSFNLGEVSMDGRKGRIRASVPLLAFSLLVTAEPYFAIGVPSDVAVMENVKAKATFGTLMQHTPKFDLVERGGYAAAGLVPFVWDARPPRDLFQARNAVRIAKWQGADRYAPEAFQKAEQVLQNAELSQQRRGNQRSAVIQSSRQAVQLAEEARVMALQKIEEERLARERAQAAEREAAAKAQAAREAAMRAEAEAERKAAEAARLAAASEAERQAALRSQAEAERKAAEQARLRAETERKASEEAQAAARAEAEKARLAAEQAEELLQQAEAERKKLEAEKQELRSRLLGQFNRILETRDSARGLILNLGDVLFDVGKSELRPEAREKLALLSGILLGHPTLTLEVEGHTDSTGSDEFNQRLSDERAASVRSYLLTQGVAAESVTSRGFGKTKPVASNDTPSGRQKNRRVEIVVSGEELGDPLGENR